MGKVNLGVEGYNLRQTGEQVQKILDAVELLNIGDTKELLELLKDIKEYDNSDDEQDIGHQLVNALNNMVSEKEVQTVLNDSKYPPSSQAVKKAIEDETLARSISDTSLQAKIDQEAETRSTDVQTLWSEVNTEESERKRHDENLYRAVYDSGYERVPDPVNMSEHFNISGFYDGAGIESNVLFALHNDTDMDIDHIYIADEYGYNLSEYIPKGETRNCILISDYQSGADHWDGYILVMSSDVSKWDEIKKLLDGQGGTWHYGTELTHTQETVQNNNIKAVKGDFYLNTEHFHVYYTQNGMGDWIYIGNLRGSVDTSKWASINSPNFTGVPTAPTPSTTNNSTQIATTEFVRDAIDRYGGSYNGNAENPFGSNTAVKINIAEWSKQVKNYTTTAVLVSSVPFTPVTGVYYQFVFDNDVLSDISQESNEDAGGVWKVQVDDILCGNEMSGAGVANFLLAYYFYYETESNSLKTVPKETFNNAFKYADYLISTLKTEVNTQIQKLESRVKELEDHFNG